MAHIPIYGREEPRPLDIVPVPIPTPPTHLPSPLNDDDQDHQNQDDDLRRQQNDETIRQLEQQIADAENQRMRDLQAQIEEVQRQIDAERQRILPRPNNRPVRTRNPSRRYNDAITGEEYNRIFDELENDHAYIANMIAYGLNAVDFSNNDLNMSIAPINQSLSCSEEAMTTSISPDPQPEPSYNTGTVDEHLSWNQAWSDPLYKEAILKEVKGWNDNKVIKLVDLPPGRRAISYRWIFSKKYGPDGLITKYKARLVARGDTQRPGEDFTETFAPVARLDSFRLLFSMAVQDDLQIHQLDVNTAFLGAPLTETLYMKVPPPWSETIKTIKPGQCFQMMKSVYGLRQAGREWYACLDQELLNIGFIRTESDPAVYRHKIYGTFLAHWVDDILIFERRKEIMNELKDRLKERFKMTDSGPLAYFLGIVFRQEPGKLFMSQEHYVDKILAYNKMTECNGRDTPMDPGTRLSKREENEEIINIKVYQRNVGSCQYLASATRPDISFAVQQLAQFNSGPTIRHWKALKHLIQYLKRTKHHGLTYTKNAQEAPTGIVGFTQRHKDKVLSGFSDADFANGEDRKSISGSVFMHKGNLISWSSKKQSLVSGSTMEAEYIAASLASRQAVWLRQLYWELQGRPATKETVLIYTDSQPAYKVAHNPSDHGRTKHIDLHYHFLRQRISLHHISLQLCSTKQMTADFLTKALPKRQYHRFKRQIGCTNTKADISEWDRKIREEDDQMLQD